MKIITPKTSSWFAKLPPGHCPIGISRGSPRGRRTGYHFYRKLAPGTWFKSVDTQQYKELYFEQLNKLDAEEVIADLSKISENNIPVMLCFEPPEPSSNWCHRGFVAAWMHDKLGIEIFEVGQEHLGFGWSHPKVPTEFRNQRLLSKVTNNLT